MSEIPTINEATATNKSATYTSGAGAGPLAFLELRGDIVAFLDHAIASALDHLSDSLIGMRVDDANLAQEFRLFSAFDAVPIDRHLMSLFQPLIAAQ